MLRKILFAPHLGLLPRRGFGTFKDISPQDMEKFNKTSSRLYRIFLKSLPKDLSTQGPVERSYITSDRSDGDSNIGFMLLQPPLNHRDYGQARLMDASITSSWTENKFPNDDKCNDRIQDILSFFLWQTQCQNADVDTFDHEELEEIFTHLRNISGNNEEVFDDDLEKSIFASDEVMKKSLRAGFRLFSTKYDLTKAEVVKYQRWAIAAIQLLQEQLDMWRRTSISVDSDRGLRITATSSCIGTTAVGHLATNENMKNRFCYRIRIENFNQPNNGIDDDENVFQLLGRKWKIMEDHEDENANDINHNDEDDHEYSDRVVTVNAPTTGVVGHLPVIRPGEVFEYMSSCDLKTQTGTMRGSFHMAVVDDDAVSAQVGDNVEAFHSSPEKLFEMPVAPFRLDATNMQ